MTPSRYLDHAATTPMAPEVIMAVQRCYQHGVAMPSHCHRLGRQAAEAVALARVQVATLLQATQGEIVFTSGGTEANNLAVLGTARSREGHGKHIITSAIEHQAILHTCAALRKQGWEITLLPVDGEGQINPADVRRAIRPDTVLVTIMHANNEIGVLQPIAEIGAICREAQVWLHTDAVQTAGHLPIDVNAMAVDMLSLSAHKLYGPKGAGALYVRAGVQLTPLFYGDGQSGSLRPGAEQDVPGIAGLGVAAALAQTGMTQDAARETALRDALLDGLAARIPDLHITGHRTQRLPNNASIVLNDIAGDTLLQRLDAVGIAVSSGSACTSGSLDPSHVLLALGIPAEDAFGSLRISLGRGTTEDDIAALLDQLPPIVADLRASPSHSSGAGICCDGECPSSEYDETGAPFVPAQPRSLLSTWPAQLMLLGLGLAGLWMLDRLFSSFASWFTFQALRLPRPFGMTLDEAGVPCCDPEAFAPADMPVAMRIAQGIWALLDRLPHTLLVLIALLFLTGVIAAVLPPRRVRQVLERTRGWLQYPLAILLGMVTPFCTCSSISLFSGFVIAGMPLGVAISYLVASSLINEVAVILLIAVYGWRVALVYVLMGSATAFVTGWWIQRMNRRDSLTPWLREAMRKAACDPAPSALPLLQSGLIAVRTMLPRVWVAVVCGVLISILIMLTVSREMLLSMLGHANWWAVPAAVLAGTPLYAHPAAVLPLLTTLLAKGMPIGVTVAFLMAVIGLSLPEWMLLARLLHRRLIMFIILCILTGIIITGTLLNYFPTPATLLELSLRP